MENVFTAFAESTDSAGGLHITLPGTLPVTILGLEPGCTTDGYALDWLTGGTGVVVILAPNLYTIVN